MNKKTEKYIDLVKKMKKDEEKLLKCYSRTLKIYEDKEEQPLMFGDDDTFYKITTNNAIKEISTAYFASKIKRSIIKIAALYHSTKLSKSAGSNGYTDNRKYADEISANIIASYKSLLRRGMINEISISSQEMLPEAIVLEQLPKKLSEETIDYLVNQIGLQMSPREVRRMSR